MARFVFVVPPLTGHINPTLSIGAVLLQRGHQVGWITLDAALAPKLPKGGELLLIQYETDDLQKQESEKYLDIITKKIVYGIDSIKFLYEEVLIPLNRHSYEGIANWLDRFKPDLVITDHQMFAGAIAAVNKGYTYATSVTAPAAIKVMDELPKVHEWEMNQVIALQKEFGVDSDTAIACSEELTMVLTSKDFFGEMELPEHYRFVGPVIHQRTEQVPFDWAQLNQQQENKKILVSIGTTFDHEHKKSFFAKVIEAFENEHLTVVVVSDPSLFEQWPSNFIVQRSVPQLELLPHLDAVVCHGGHNTVCETLTHGLPMVVVPIAYDQSHVAGRVVRVGAGLRLNFNRFKAKHLKEAVAEILGNACFKNAAIEISASFSRVGGTEKAADLLVELAKEPVIDC
ncbi:glycosyltransferase, MGT family [Pedobacter steynii]|uniref:Glycosyltransferase, MGT family n=1 Tax=Pedobacter steynii TaxID=430522 RepID=A0A1G9ZF86_9SPHI|nr:nucleotide disphospho-sugar-binding domain-containing protein [Pedobacter steynii]NQX40048.1 glycosyl transferase [Pedobacter steynii]SDN20082.1 glycosyltransferase, MGT family [Pedobacter steynii]